MMIRTPSSARASGLHGRSKQRWSTIRCSAARAPDATPPGAATHRRSAPAAPLGSQSPSSNRRQTLMALLAASLWTGTAAQEAWANEQLPKAYQEVVRKLAKSLRESIEAEQTGQSEADVRRKAEGAKEALQTFVRRWQDDSKVKGHPSHQQVLAILQELSAFFQTSGPRARLPSDLQARLLRLVDAAEAALDSPAASSVSPPPPRTRAAPAVGGAEDEELLRELLPSS